MQPTIKQLSQSPADYPDDVQSGGLTLLSPNGVQFPPWGTPNREAQVTDLLNDEFFDPQLARWRDVYGTAKKITQGATTPYEAVALIERTSRRTTRTTRRPTTRGAPTARCRTSSWTARAATARCSPAA